MDEMKKNNGGQGSGKNGGVVFPIESKTERVSEGGGRLRRFADMAKERAVSRADGARTSLAAKIEAYAGVLENVGGVFNEKGHTRHHQLTGTAAKALRNISNNIVNSDAEIMLDKATAFAKKNPAVFALGCAALGFVGARILLKR